MAALFALVGAYGVFLVYTAVVFRWRGVGLGPAVSRRAPKRRTQDWLAQAGLDDVRPREFVAVTVALFVLGAALAFALFGGVLPALVAGAFASTLPVTSYRSRRQRHRSEAREAWPRMIEEMRIQTGSLGRSIPQALFEVGRRGPEELRPAFAAAEREWRLSTDFPRTVATLKDRLADASADATLETLLVAHEVGGSNLDGRLGALIEDRLQDLHGRKDARAKQAGVRFTRWFVLAVPMGMTLAGLSIGTGR
jgi:tight adherence protein B